MKLHTPSQARGVARMRAMGAPDPKIVGMCLRVTRQLYEAPARHRTAAEAFAATRQRGKGPAPAGALHWWLGGAQGYGHVALGNGPHRVWSIDNVRRGGIDLVTLARIERTWPALRYVGWSRDINGVTVVPRVDLSELLARGAGADVVIGALVEEQLLPPSYRRRGASTAWAPAVVEAYAAWQERAGYGPATPGRPGPSDGLPGLRSLTTLGLRRGFAVAP